MKQSQSLKTVSSTIFLVLCLLGYASVSNADSAGATMDASSTIRSFTGMAGINCFDDGNGEANQLTARIRDDSPPMPGLLVNLQIFKGNKANSISDTVSGDAEFSPFITLQNGPGVYWVMVNKTDVGERRFVVEYHCIATDGVAHTGTDIFVTQFGEPAFTP